MHVMDLVERVIEGGGGVFNLATKCGVSHQAVYKWRRTGIPPKRVLLLERLSGVSRHDLRPDLYPPSESASGSLSTIKRKRA
jgi:DNA-binding transcriptional regulator YdaS (Cro superfamily)